MQLTLAFVAVLSVLPGPQQAKQDTLSDRVAALVRDLDADQFAVRKSARESLIEIGAEALPFLNVPANASVELRLEIQEIRLKLQNERAVRSLEAARVSLRGDLTVDQIADRLSRETNNRLSVARLPSDVRGRMLTMDGPEQPFWEAIIGLANTLKCGLLISDGAVRFVPEIDNRMTSVNGANLIRLGKIGRKELVGQDGKSLLRLPLFFSTEPRLRALFVESSGSGTVVESEGKNLTPFSRDRKLELPVGGRGEEVAWRHDVLVQADSIPETIDVRGEIDVLMAAGYERFEFKDLATARGRRLNREGVVLVINDVEIDDDRGNLSLTITVNWKRSVAAFDSYRTWQFHNEVWLQSPDGKRIDFTGPLRTDGQAGGGVRLTYTFKGVAETLRKCTFMYEAPTALKTVTVPFRFEGVATQDP